MCLIWLHLQSYIVISIVEGKNCSLDTSVVVQGQLRVCCNEQLFSTSKIQCISQSKTAPGLACHD